MVLTLMVPGGAELRAASAVCPCPEPRSGRPKKTHLAQLRSPPTGPPRRLSGGASVSYRSMAQLHGVGMSGKKPQTATDFELLYERFRLPVYRLIRGMVLDSGAAEELAQEAFQKAYATRHKFRGDFSASAWLHGIAVNVASSHLRRRRVARFFAGRARPPGGLEAEEDRRQGSVERALAALSPGLRAVVLLSLYAHLSAEEVALILGTSPETVSSRLHAATEVMAAAIASSHPAEAG
jgi:RNA polymerase sigma factor (sigma-70 family)